MLDILASEMYRMLYSLDNTVFRVVLEQNINIHKASGTLGRIFQLKRPQDVHMKAQT